MMLKMRRGWFRLVVATSLTMCLLMYLKFYFPSLPKSSTNKTAVDTFKSSRSNSKTEALSPIHLVIAGKGQGIPNPKCTKLEAPKVNTYTADQYQLFDFQPSWMGSKEFWDTNFEKRYLLRRTKWKKFPLKVFLMPHSHNDPGWLKTFEEYYFHQTSRILNNLVDKMFVHKNMTFVWAEVSFLSLWYDRSLPVMREKMKQLLKSGRLEVATGGWVMTDEANAHLFAMVTQLIEGQQWLYNAFDYKPKNGWSIDVFGHGAAVPYLLKEAGIETTVVQRLHFAWKQWLAEKQMGDFMWRQVWDSKGELDMLTHNRPFDIYSIKHSCGPHPQTCLNFDFRKVFGEYTEYSYKAVNIDDRNVKEKAEQLLDQYGRTGSLVPHNVILVPLGDDFRYNHATEWDQQYLNYQRLMDHINSHNYYAEVQWGTLTDYYKAVRERTKSFSTLMGDFHVYSDIFSEGRPAYWSGYYTTRPYFKILCRQLEASLHAAEVLYTWAWNNPFRKRFNKIAHLLEKDYERLVKARRHLSLFQHHDAITGTSKSYVMHDYGLKLHEGVRESFTVICHASLALLATESTLVHISDSTSSDAPFDYVQPTFEQLSYEKLRSLIPIAVNKPQRVIILANSLGQRRYELVKLIIDSINIRLTDEHGQDVPFQINPIWNSTDSGMVIISTQFELFFLADLPPLSLITYSIIQTKQRAKKSNFATVFSNFYGTPPIETSSVPIPFDTKKVLPGDIQLESDTLKVLFDGITGMIRSVAEKSTGKITQLLLKYAAYPSAQFKSGAYLFKTDPNANKPEDDVLAGAKARIFIQSGPLTSELTVIFGSALLHTYRIFHVSYEPLASAIYMENSFNLDGHQYSSKDTPGFTPQYRDTELFFRFSTDLNNGPHCRFYTDQGGLNMQERLKVERIGIQGNYYPVTTATYIEDDLTEANRRRLTLLVDHAVGAASWKVGWLETMVERRMFYDDARGMGEGVTDQKRTVGRYWLLMEHLRENEEVAQLSLAAHHLSNSLNFPVVPMVLEGLDSDALQSTAHLVNRPFPCSLHLLTLRTLSQPEYPQMRPSNKALMIVQHQSPSCVTSSAVTTCQGLQDFFVPEMNLTIPVSEIEETDLTGLTKRQRLASLSDLTIGHHRLRTVKLTFDN